MKDPKCKCGEYALYSIAITSIRTGYTATIDYCRKCIPASLMEEVKRK